MTKISNKSTDNQSEAMISLANNKICHLSPMTSFVKWGPDMQRSSIIIYIEHFSCFQTNIFVCTVDCFFYRHSDMKLKNIHLF